MQNDEYGMQPVIEFGNKKEALAEPPYLLTCLLTTELPVLLLELFHELDQDFHIREFDRVVDGGAHTAHGTMTLEADHVHFLGFFGEGVFQFFAGQAEGD